MRRLALLLPALAAGCRSTVEVDGDPPALFAPAAFSTGADVAKLASENPWWSDFGSPALDAVIEDTLTNNLELQQAWTRLEQAAASARIARSSARPQIDLNATARDQTIDQSGGGANQIPIRLGDTYSLGPSLSYELDLFGRIRASRQAAEAELRATEADLAATALGLTGTATDAWFTGVAARAGLALVDEQIRVGEELLEVTERRLASGGGSALDVLQQQRLLEATRAERPRLLGELERAGYALDVLAGRSAGRVPEETFPDRLPDLPPVPALDVPEALLHHRPDLLAALERLEAADRNLATALADRYPRLTLTASSNFDGNEVSELFDRSIRSIAGSLVLPLVDGGRRRAEVASNRAGLDAAMFALSQTFLVAIREVEDALSQERRGLERVDVLERQRGFAEGELEQARRRYAGGVDPYLTVLTATQNLQALERTLIDERVTVLRARVSLLLALGGPWVDRLALHSLQAPAS